MTEGLHNGLESAVDVEVVGSYRGDDRNIGFQAQERSVELVSLNGQAVALAEDHITVKVLRDTTQKGVATHIRSGVEPRNHSRCGGLAVRTCNGHNILTLCKMAQHLRAFFHQEATLVKKYHLRMVRRNGGGIDYHSGCGVAERLGDSIHGVLIGHSSTLGLQGASEGCLSAVVARHSASLVQKITGQGTHTNAAYAHKVYVGVIHLL